ncbi:MAG TPA: 23S rRNA (guanosine(2251)-2'-O)-methyltransferase RlmB, partial [Mycobacteriales bacterium]
MAGNSQRRGARRGTGSKKGATVGSGGQRRRGLEGRGPTPPAEARKGHPAARRAAAAARSAPKRPPRDRGDTPEL